MSDNQKFCLAEILQGQEHLKQRRKQFSLQHAEINIELSQSYQLAKKAIENGETTGNKIRDAVIKEIGFSGKSIEWILGMHLQSRGVDVGDVNTQVVFIDDELASIKIFESMPDLSLKKETIDMLATAFKTNNVMGSNHKSQIASFMDRKGLTHADFDRLMEEMIGTDEEREAARLRDRKIFDSIYPDFKGD